MKHILLLSVLIIGAIAARAQDFNHAAGVRLGLTPGFEYRSFTDGANSYRFLLGTRDRGVQLHLLKEFHEYDLTSISDQLVLFYGLGVHAGYERWDEQHFHNNAYWIETRTSLIAGLDGVVGWEYYFYEVPVVLGLELKPFVEFMGPEVFELELFDFAFSMKYVF